MTDTMPDFTVHYLPGDVVWILDINAKPLKTAIAEVRLDEEGVKYRCHPAQDAWSAWSTESEVYGDRHEALVAAVSHRAIAQRQWETEVGLHGDMELTARGENDP